MVRRIPGPVRSGHRTYPWSAFCSPVRTDEVSPKCGMNRGAWSWGAGRVRVFGGRTRLRRVGVGHRAPCRRNRNGFKGKRKCARGSHLLFFYHRPDRSGPRCWSSSRERPRLQRGGTLIDHRMGQVRRGLPCTSVETRIDGAFLNRTIAEQLNSLKVECTIPVPFGRFATLKGLVEGGKRWRRPTEGIDYLETRWKPKLWNARHRFIPIEKRVRRRHKLPFPAILIMGCA